MYDMIDARGSRASDQRLNFRPIHYLGSKLRYIGHITAAIDEADPTHGGVCDLFAGSGTVAYALSRSRRVIAADIQYYSVIISKALLSRGRTQGFEADLGSQIAEGPLLSRLMSAMGGLLEIEDDALAAETPRQINSLRGIIESGSLVAAQSGQLSPDQALQTSIADTLERLRAADLLGPASTITRHFGGAYFSYRQAMELDAIAATARALGSPTILAAALGAASEIVNTVGKQFAQPLKLSNRDGELKRHLLAKVLRERRLSASAEFSRFANSYRMLPDPVNADNQFIQGDYRDILPTLAGQVSVVYADPPYTRDHYSRYYHVLETISLGDDPNIDSSNIGPSMSRGFYRSERHQSDFCIKSKAPGAFKALFSGVANLGVPLVLSYSAADAAKSGRPRLLSTGDLIELARASFSAVEVRRIADSGHSKLTSVSVNKGPETSSEIILVCRN